MAKLFLSHELWNKYRDKVVVHDLVKEVQPIFSVIDSYHRTNDADLTVADLANLLLSHSSKDREYYLGVIDNLATLEVSKDTSIQLLHSILENKALKEISLAAYDVTEGRGSIDKLRKMMEDFQSITTVEEEMADPFVTDDLEVLADNTVNSPGLRWRTQTLNEMLGPLRKGNFGFVFARPETGKTTFLASETTFMAEQLTDDSGPIIWFNNEEEGNTVKIRNYQASLGIPLPQLLANKPANYAAYLQKTKGKHKIYDSGSIHRSTVENLCKQYSPSLVVFDQIDKIKGFDNDREDLRLGAIYIWARELAKKYCPVIGVCQADGSGEGQKYLTMANVANAKTSKQAEADWILGIGKVHDPGYENLRYLHLSKNKLPGGLESIPEQRHAKREVLINPMIARYESI